MIDVNYPILLDLFRQHIDPKRSESASFLIWYLENYYRLDALEAVDSVCDQKGDKGVDGVFVNDNDQTITIFQSRISQSAQSSTGDSPLKEFAGTISQFETAAKIQSLIDTAGNAQVAALAKRLDLVNKIATHELRGEYVTNIDLDANGKAFLAGEPYITFVGKTELCTTYISSDRTIPVRGPIEFDRDGFPVAEYVVDAGMRSIIAPIKANELIKLDGISDQSIFAYNVRGPLGRTQVNKDIVKSLKDKASHKLFPLFHNGITVIASDITLTDQKLVANDYFVVNGCQSLTALYNNADTLTDNLRVLVKFVKTDPRSDTAKMITEFSNNQNSVKARDFKANNQIQVRLQNEVASNYNGEYALEIKRGEALGPGIKISNEDAGVYMLAFDLGQPWATHRKNDVFEDKHADVFGRPQVTADWIVLLHVTMDAIAEEIPNINNKLLGRYVLTRYMILYILHEALKNDDLWKAIVSNPNRFVRKPENRARFRTCIKAMVSDIIVDVNGEVDELGDTFDYRDKLRDQDWVSRTSRKIVGDHLIRIKRGRIPSFKDEWEKVDANGAS